ncbi:MAG: hypothetical protein ACXADX_20970 [Candidatus Hodarchaeales archaeon]|jgi:hypothetical protein
MSALGERPVLSLLGIAVMVGFFLLPTTSPALAYDLADPASDVKFANTNEVGPFTEGIDILQVSTQGSWVKISSRVPPPLEMSNRIHRLLVMFSDNRDPTDWEAAIMLTSFGENNVQIAWKVGKVTLEEAMAHVDSIPTGWKTSFTMTSYAVFENTTYIGFTEYHATSYAQLAVWTEVIMIGANDEQLIFHDWAPDTLEGWSFEASEEIRIGESDQPPTSEPEPSDSSDDSRSAPSSVSTTAISGFGIISIVMMIPLLYLIQRRRKRGAVG